MNINDFSTEEYGLSDGRFVDLKKLEDDYLRDMALRDRVCP